MGELETEEEEGTAALELDDPVAKGGDGGVNNPDAATDGREEETFFSRKAMVFLVTPSRLRGDSLSNPLLFRRCR